MAWNVSEVSVRYRAPRRPRPACIHYAALARLPLPLCLSTIFTIPGSALFQCPCPFGSYSHVPAALSESSGKHVVTHLPEINLRESNSATDMERPRVPALGVTATSGHVRTRKCSDRATTTVLSTTVLSTTVLWPLTRCTYLRCHYTMNAAQ